MTVKLYPAFIDADRHAAVKRAERTAELHYIGIGATSDTDTEVITAINIDTPGTYGTGGELIRNDADIDYVGGIGLTIWNVTVRYVHPEHKDAEEEQDSDDGDEYSFDTSGGKVHITNSFSTVNTYPAPSQTAPDPKGTINEREGAIEGIDILAPALRFTIKRVLTASTVDLAYIKTLSDLTGTVANATFKGFPTGEVLFVGAQGSRQSGGDWPVTFNFDTSENETGITIGDITGIAKEGWDYLWVLYREKEDTAAKMRIKNPSAVYVEQVYRRKAFSALGIGT